MIYDCKGIDIERKRKWKDLKGRGNERPERILKWTWNCGLMSNTYWKAYCWNLYLIYFSIFQRNRVKTNNWQRHTLMCIISLFLSLLFLKNEVIIIHENEICYLLCVMYTKQVGTLSDLVILNVLDLKHVFKQLIVVST